MVIGGHQANNSTLVAHSQRQLCRDVTQPSRMPHLENGPAQCCVLYTLPLAATCGAGGREPPQLPPLPNGVKHHRLLCEDDPGRSNPTATVTNLTAASAVANAKGCTSTGTDRNLQPSPFQEKMSLRRGSLLISAAGSKMRPASTGQRQGQT